jgi:hypothetical protein
MHLSDGFVEIIGTVKEDGTVKALTNIDLGNNIGEFSRRCTGPELPSSLERAVWRSSRKLTGTDMKAVNNVVEFAHSSKGEGVFS